MNWPQLFLIGFLFLLISSAPINSQVPELPSYDDATYYGYEYGATGIAQALLKVISSNITLEKHLSILESTGKVFNSVWDSRIEYDGGKVTTWSREPDQEVIYPGKKYGPVGIINAFLDYHNVTTDVVWLERAEEGYWSLASYALNESTTPHWSYAYLKPQEEGIPITDLKYGSAGVLELNLRLFELTQNSSYLDHADLLVSWLQTTKVEIDVEGKTYEVIPWYYVENATLPVKTGYGWGIAGIAPILYRYANFRNLESIKDWAIQLGEFLVKIQNKDGSWDNEYKSKFVINGLDEGVAGVIYGLNQLGIISGLSKFNNSIERGIRYLFNHFEQSSEILGFFENMDDKVILNTFYRGSLGIYKTLFDLNSFLTPDQYSKIILGYEWLLSKGCFIIKNGHDNLFFLSTTYDHTDIVDFSYAEGLAGMLSEMIDIYNSPISNDIDIDIGKAIIGAINTLLFYQNEDGLWTRQRSILSDVSIEYLTTFSETTKFINPNSSISTNRRSSFYQSWAIGAIYFTYVFCRAKENHNKRSKKS